MSCLVEVERLRYAYPQGRSALDGISFHLSHGERVGLIGPNGAGKTTLLLALAGLLDPFAGTIMVAGCNLATAAGRRQVHQKLGFVFQNPDDQIINATVADDVAFGPLNLGLPEDEVRRRVDQSLHRVGLPTECRDRVPFHLSSGEKRRVAIAGVLAMEPEVVLMDEPTSDLDPRGRRELRQILDALPITRIISSHNLEFVLDTCDRALLLDEGQLRADGPVRQVLADEELMLRHGLEVPDRIPAAERRAAAMARAAGLTFHPDPNHPHVHSHPHPHPHPPTPSESPSCRP
ncbi:MAG: energy-coupling factor ABC transporter ATP-binding protein [Verrucomicrobia bacterium]|nr:energy-coupling factor ABC transporter ATP-binding protein [Verrucomicrobiota bacterium]